MTQRYSKYKDSGIEWIGEIPEHWGLNRLKQFGYIYAGLNGKKGDDFSKEYLKGSQEFVPFTTICNYTQIKEENFQYVKVKATEFQNEVVKNDLLFLMSSETLEDIAKSSVYLLDKKSLLNSFCKGFRIESNKLNPIYINYLLNCSTYRKYFELCGRGFTRINIKQEYVCNTLITIPPLPEQESIAQFLDEKCARIDEAVRIKEKQIDLLKEYRQIAIHHAVTKGLNDQVKMKDSGIDWIGEIPEHWEVKKNKELFTEINEPGNAELPILSVSIHTAVSHDELNEDENIRGKIRIEDKSNYKLVKKRDVVFNMMRAWQGAIGVVRTKGMVSPAYVVARPIQSVNSDFLEYEFRTARYIQAMNRVSKGITDFRKRLYWNEFKQLETIIPPLAEQAQIVARLETLTAKTDEAIRLKEQQIEQLKKYKNSLINELVTGKIRVF